MTILYLTEDYLYSKVHNNLLCSILKKDNSLKIYVFSPVRQDNAHGLENSYKSDERLIVLTPKIDIPIWRYKVDFWAKQRCKVRLIEKLLPIHEIDAIHAATLYTEGATALRLKKKYGIPYFVSLRGADSMFYDKKMPHLWNLGNQVIKYANKIACLTPCIKDSMLSVWHHFSVKKYLENSDVVNNGIDNIWLENLNAEPHKANSPVRLLYIGRFDSNKNVYRLIQAVKLVRESIDIKLTIIGGVGGNDEEHDVVMGEIVAHQDYIEYLGAIYDKQKLMQIVRECDVFAMVSHSETFGLVYVECLTQGLPLLYSKGTGFDGMYPDGHVGYRVDSYSIEDIANGIKRIISNYHDLRKNISLLDFGRYSWNVTSMKYLEYYHIIQDPQVPNGVIAPNMREN